MHDIYSELISSPSKNPAMRQELDRTRLDRVSSRLGGNIVHRMKSLFFSNASRARIIAPGDLPGSISVIPSPDNPLPIGIASEVGRVGGYDWESDRDIGPLEAVWRLVVGKEENEGRFILRGGAFVELAEGSG